MPEDLYYMYIFILVFILDVCLSMTQKLSSSNPTSKERWLCGHRRAKRSYSTFKVRRGGREEIPPVQGKEQQLHFAGADMKRYPMPKVREAQVRR